MSFEGEVFSNTAVPESDEDAAEIPFEDIEKALLGRTQFTKPIVEKSVIVRSLQSSTRTVKGIATEMKEQQQTVNSLVEKVDGQGARLGSVEGHVDKMNMAMATANKTLALHKQNFEVLGDLQVVAGLAARMEAAEAGLRQLQEDFAGRLGELVTRVSGLEGTAAALQETAATQAEQLVELRVEANKANELVDSLMEATSALPEMQEKVAGFEADLGQMKDYAQTNASAIAENKAAIEAKADQELLAEVQQVAQDAKGSVGELAQKMNRLQKQMGEAEDGGGPAVEKLRQALNETRKNMEVLNNDMQGKVSEAEVDDKIQGKYDHVLAQVNKAVKASADDDKELQRVSKELTTMIKKVQASMVDKRDFHQVKAKVNEDTRLKQQLELLRDLVDERITTEKAEALISEKPDKDELLTLMRQMTQDMGERLQHALDGQVEGQAGTPWAMQTHLAGSLTPQQRGALGAGPSTASLGSGMGEGSGSPSRGGPHGARPGGRPSTTPNRKRGNNTTTSPAGLPAGGASGSVEPVHCLACHRRFDSWGHAAAPARPGAEEIMAVQGPGGTALGGGFQARLQVRAPARLDAFNSLPAESGLPRIDPRQTFAAAATPYVIGKDGRTYHGFRTPGALGNSTSNDRAAQYQEQRVPAALSSRGLAQTAPSSLNGNLSR